MGRRLPALLLPFAFVALAGALGATPQGATDVCAALPQAPAGLPAPVRLATRCGAFVIDRDGRVERRATRAAPEAHWPRGALDRRADLWLVQRDGRLAVERRGEILWRSSHRYRLSGTPDYLVATALSRHAVAFSFNHGALYIARFGEPERIVARGEHPLLWARGGLLTYRSSREGMSFFVRAAAGRLLRRLATHVESFAVEEASRSLLLLTPSGLLARTHGERYELLADVGALANPGVELPGGGLITLYSDGGKRVRVLDSDGRWFASAELARYPSAVSASPDGGAIAFVVTQWSGDYSAGRDEIVVIRRGARSAAKIYARSHHGSPCGRTAALTWRGDDLLYWTSEGAVVVLDSRGERPPVDLTATAAALPGVRPEWAAASPG